jgi:hypothetical protein
MPTLEALKDLGGSARIEELLQRVVEREGLTDEQVAVRRSPEHHTLIEYRLAWALNYLKNIGAIETRRAACGRSRPSDARSRMAKMLRDFVRGRRSISADQTSYVHSAATDGANLKTVVRKHPGFESLSLRSVGQCCASRASCARSGKN